MSIEVKVPQLPESVADATLVSWHKAAGDEVRRDENLVDLETDKVVLEVPAPASGVLKAIKITDGTTVTSGDVLALLEPGEVSAVEAPPPVETTESPAAPTPTPAPTPTSPPAPGTAARRLSPAVARLMEEHDLDPTNVVGTGRDGRITKGDVLSYLSAKSKSGSTSVEDLRPVPSPADGTGGTRAEQRVAMTRLRARIAERLVEAQQTAAMLTTFNEVDMTEVIGLRTRYRDDFQERYGIKLGFMSFFVKACVEALRRFPVVNASVEDSDIIYHEYFDIGVAVSTDRGLMVPIIRNAESMSFAEIERAVADFSKRARSGDINMEELTGGTFTITNGGIFGSMMSTPILNPPQSGILGMHRIQERAVVLAGEVVVRPMMYLALTYDHRVVDGRESVQFLVALKEQLEDPARLILQV